MRRQAPRGRYKIQKRFYVMLVLVVLIIFLVARMFMSGGKGGETAVVQASSSGSQYTGDIVILRNETLYASEGVTRVDFVADEGSTVYKGNAICTVYSAGYNQTEINKLENYRSQIKQYHKENIMTKEVDSQIEKYDLLVDNYAKEVRTLIQGEGIGSLNNLEKQLASALTSRQSYLKQKYPDDQTLTSLYEEESRQLKRIESWTTTYTASEECFVSFYTDGYESIVNASSLEELTLSQIKTVLSGGTLDSDIVSRGKKAIFRTVRQDEWYAILVTHNNDWNPIVGQIYKMQLDGFDNYLVDATVESFSRSGSELMVKLKVISDVEPVLSIRTSRVAVGEFVDGLSVPTSALYAYQGMIGVVVTEASIDTFVQVNVVSYDENIALVTPAQAGSPLQAGKSVRLYK